jgi:hypothetical protein
VVVLADEPHGNVVWGISERVLQVVDSDVLYLLDNGDCDGGVASGVTAYGAQAFL